VVVFIAGTSGNVIQGNFIGTDAAGTGDLGNSLSGVQIREGASGNVIGGTVARARNVISGNGEHGVLIQEVGTTGNRAKGNYIGTDRTGTSNLGNGGDGVRIAAGATGNVIGGAAASARNVISGNNFVGVAIGNAGTSGNRVLGNFVGTDRTGTADLGNGAEGVLITSGASGNVIGAVAAGGGNLIAHNVAEGVLVLSGTGNAVLGNRIFANGGLGIDLGNDGVTDNDLDDPDPGANLLFNFPVIDVARLTPAGLRVRGSINTETNKTVRIEFFASPAPEPGERAEGKRFLGFVIVMTGSGHDASFNVLLPSAGVLAGQVITATATDELGNTSEFSEAKEVTMT
jgi:hypothetical protein